MKKKSRLPLAILGLLLTTVSWCTVIFAGELFPGWLNGLLTGMGGALGGYCGTVIFMEVFSRRCTPEQRKELERGETDERNVAIRKEAASSSWHWTLYLLWALFILCLVLHQPLYIALSAGVIVLHCVFYLINIGRWAKKL